MKNLIYLLLIVIISNNYLFSQEVDSADYTLKLTEIENKIPSGYYAYGGNYSFISESYYLKLNIIDTSSVLFFVLNSENDTLILFNEVLNPNYYQIDFELNTKKFLKETCVFYGYLIINNYLYRKRNLLSNNDITFLCKIGFFY